MFKSIVCTYPDFRALPKGLKQLLLASENLFFGKVKTPAAKADNGETGKKHPLPPLKKIYFTRRRESPPGQSRAFKWGFWTK